MKEDDGAAPACANGSRHDGEFPLASSLIAPCVFGQRARRRRIDRMIQLTLRADFDPTQLETGGLCLEYHEVSLLFNVGPFPGGGDCLGGAVFLEGDLRA